MSSEFEIRLEYESRFPALTEVAGNLEVYLRDVLRTASRIDRISARAKSPDRFTAKAIKLDDVGVVKYADPFHEIQDQIGARITVFYLSDVDIIKSEVKKYFRFIELKSKAPISDSEFGYFGLHFIIDIPDDVVPEGSEENVPDFFELQIKTLFQHAWSEAHHDLGYKSIRDLVSDEQRKIAFTAAQAWGADTIFEELAKTLVHNDNPPTVDTNGAD